ncbi:Hypothetical predicted protein [Olea europaea subsp. europaea]|uniref:Uncharacterized protein n=1 Tax=Olea europaea subsp. europaea TaxID=158383 RepID=A0A8S0S7M4_OLEEU|nr:Hypothetical predicted protein [Olea europaea subsp. europaea]
MHENQATSLLWPGRIPDKAYTPFPRNCLERPGHSLQTVSQKLPKKPGNVPALQRWPAHCAAFVCLKSAHIHAVARTRPGHGLHTVSQRLPRNALDMAYTPCPRNCLEMLKNQASSLPQPESVPNLGCTPCPEMPENQAASLSWPECIPDMACTSCPRNCPECPGTCLRVPENLLASPLWPRRVPDMAYIPYPENCLEMPENQVASLPSPRHGLYTVSEKLLRNALKLGCVPIAARKRPEYGLYTEPRNCIVMPTKLGFVHVVARTSPRRYLHTMSHKLPRNA